MRQLLTSFIFFSYLIASCQNTASKSIANTALATHDTLSKYSYFVYAKKQTANTIDAKQGTCFFVKKAGKTFIVSAKHVFTTWQGDSTISKKRYDTLYIRIPSKESNRFDFVPVDVSEFNNKTQPNYYYTSPDVIAIELKNADNYSLNSIEKFISPSKTSLGDSAICYGFPENETDTPDNFMFTSGDVFKSILISAPQENINYMDNRRHIQVLDSFNYAVKTSMLVKGGFSGAPIFIKDKSNRYIFGGLVSQGIPTDGIALIIKPSMILSRINYGPLTK